jgi:hypothetical protein
MYKVAFDVNRSRAMSVVFKLKAVILYRPHRVEARQFSTRFDPLCPTSDWAWAVVEDVQALKLLHLATWPGNAGRWHLVLGPNKAGVGQNTAAPIPTCCKQRLTSPTES